VMETGLFPDRPFTKFVLPENDAAAFACRNPAFFSKPLVFSSRAAHGSVIGTDRTLIFKPAKLMGHYTCLHPDALRVVYRLFSFHSGGNHVHSPCQKQAVIG